MVSKRIICVKIKSKPVDVIIIQVYAPTIDATQTEIGDFYLEIDDVVKLQKKFQDCLIIIGDFNDKVGDKKRGRYCGPIRFGHEE